MSIRYEDAETRTALDALMQAERICLFWEKFDKLSEECRKVMRMHFNEEDMAQLAEAMNYGNENNARQHKFHCQRNLIQLIKADPRFAELVTA